MHFCLQAFTDQFHICTLTDVIDLFHIVISLSLAARYLARFRVALHTWDNYCITLINYKVTDNNIIRCL